MKIVAVNPESKETQEVEISEFSDNDLDILQTLHFPENMNPEGAVRSYIEGQDIPADQKAKYWEKLKVLAQAVLQVGDKVIFVGRKILDFILHLLKSYPNLAIGLALGAVFGSLIAGIPVIGFLIGTVAKIFLPLIGGFLGFKEDLADRAFKRRIFDTINDKAVEEEVEQEVQIYKPLNTPAQSAGRSEGASYKSGLDRGIARGVAAMKSTLVAQTESRFGKETAEDLKNLLFSVENLDDLSKIGNLLVECKSDNNFIQKASESLN